MFKSLLCTQGRTPKKTVPSVRKENQRSASPANRLVPSIVVTPWGKFTICAAKTAAENRSIQEIQQEFDSKGLSNLRNLSAVQFRPKVICQFQLKGHSRHEHAMKKKDHQLLKHLQGPCPIAPQVPLVLLEAALEHTYEII